MIGAHTQISINDILLPVTEKRIMKYQFNQKFDTHIYKGIK